MSEYYIKFQVYIRNRFRSWPFLLYVHFNIQIVHSHLNHAKHFCFKYTLPENLQPVDRTNTKRNPH